MAVTAMASARRHTGCVAATDGADARRSLLERAIERERDIADVTNALLRSLWRHRSM